MRLTRIASLSITKWIHLNQGDDGLVAFFRKIHTVLHEGGHLVLEPQSWESYAKAKRMAEVCLLLLTSPPKADTADSTSKQLIKLSSFVLPTFRTS